MIIAKFFGLTNGTLLWQRLKISTSVLALVVVALALAYGFRQVQILRHPLLISLIALIFLLGLMLINYLLFSRSQAIEKRKKSHQQRNRQEELICPFPFRGYHFVYYKSKVLHQ
jgi:hypothetical protein